MKKISFVFSLFLIVLSHGAMAQDTAKYCNCYNLADSLTFSDVKFTLGDSVTPPYYKNDSNTSQAIKLPFSFCFYGTSYDTVYISNKGVISFVKPIHNFTNGNLPAGKDTIMIAPFWANINNLAPGPMPPGLGEAWYKVFNHSMIVYWQQSEYYRFDCDLYDSFKLTITDGTDSSIPGGNNVSFCYYDMQWAVADSSGGSMGFGGIPATIGINKGDGSTCDVISRVSLPGYGFNGSSSASNGLYWFNGKSFAFNTCVTDKNIPPIILDPDKCDTLELCPYDSATGKVIFLCSEPGQKAKISFMSPTLSGVKVDTLSNAAGLYSATLHVYAGPLDIGTHTITVTATDNSSPAQVSHYPVIVKVDACTGINEVKSNTDSFSVYPNASNGNFTVELANEQSPKNCMLQIYDLLGKNIYSMVLNKNKTEVDLSSQAKGIYIVKLFKENSLLGVKKVVIQ